MFELSIKDTIAGCELKRLDSVSQYHYQDLLQEVFSVAIDISRNPRTKIDSQRYPTDPRLAFFLVSTSQNHVRYSTAARIILLARIVRRLLRVWWVARTLPENTTRGRSRKVLNSPSFDLEQMCEPGYDTQAVFGTSHNVCILI
jgi:hypothetical protein